MQPIKVLIEGNYWDCQIYSGWLYLWTMDNDLFVYDWGNIVSSFNIDKLLKPAFHMAFEDGSHLYNNVFNVVFQDTDILELMKSRFESLSKGEFHLSQKDIEPFLLSVQPSPFTDLHNDSEISNNKVFVASDDGLFEANTRSKALKYSVSSNVNKLWDCPLLSIKGNLHAQMALSAGNDGLYQYDNRNAENGLFIRDEKIVENKFEQLSSKHSQFANWNFLSIYNSSTISESFLAAFSWHKLENNRFIKKYDGEIAANEIFKSNGVSYLSWGGEDKIYKSTDAGISVVNMNGNFSPDRNDVFSNVVSIDIDKWSNHVIAAGIAFFGAIAECDDSLWIIKSDNSVDKIDSEVTNWRTYPKSKFYQNHLHIIHDDFLEIRSYNHDSFMDQMEKPIGSNYLLSDVSKK